MADIVSKEKRSQMMSGIRSKDTKPELRVRSFLHRKGLRYKLHEKLPGKPDLVFPKYKTVLFVHGCFWHRHTDCRYCTTPQTNPDFWAKKFASNVERDQRATAQLEEMGFRVLLAWECSLSDAELERLAATILGTSS